MRRWASLTALWVLLLVPATARAQEPPPFSEPWFVRGLLGGGGVPELPNDDRTGNLVDTFEIGHHPVAGRNGGALSTGFSMSWTGDAWGHWFNWTPGLFAQLDLTYVLLSGLWATSPPSSFPVRLNLGSRLGLGVNESSRPSQDLPYAASFLLLRPELMTYLQVDVPLDARHQWVIVTRGAIDTSVNLGETYRWSFTSGFAYGWGAP